MFAYIRRHIIVTGEDEVSVMLDALRSIGMALNRVELAFRRMAGYLQEMAGASSRVASGDLEIVLRPRSARDLLGNALAEMIANLKTSQQRIQRQMANLQAIHTIEQITISTNNIAAILNAFAQAAQTYLTIEHIYLWERLPNAQIVLRATWGSPPPPDDLIPQEIHIRIENVLQTGLPEVIQPPDSASHGYLWPLRPQNAAPVVLEVYSNRSPAYPQEWHEYLKVLPDILTLALERQALIENLEARVAERTVELAAQHTALHIARQHEREQRLLAEAGYEIASASNSHLPIEALYEKIVEQTLRIVSGQMAAILLLQDGLLTLGAVHATGNIPSLAAIYKPIPLTSIPHLVAALENPQATPIEAESLAPILKAPLPWAHRILVAPLHEQTSLLGFILVASTQPAFDESTGAHLTRLATHAASAITYHGMYARLQTLAVTDGLTGLLNRRALMNAGDREIASQPRLSIIMMDIDHFKNINDTYGHLVGDHALQHLARVCTTLLREADIIGRYGGEEFVIILPNTSISSASRIAQRVHHVLRSTPITIAPPQRDSHHCQHWRCDMGRRHATFFRSAHQTRR
ncbi:MAG: hypothetical protein Fur0018_10590 [Anaerolineales bacterium]